MRDIRCQIVIDEEKEKALKTGYVTLYANLFHTPGSVLKYGVCDLVFLD
jgi:hypothetical protein